MCSADSAQSCLITVHLGQRPNGSLGCEPGQTMLHLASVAVGNLASDSRGCVGVASPQNAEANSEDKRRQGNSHS